MRPAWLVVVVVAACADVPQPFDLDHARIMAVRIDPPAIAAGERARIDVLITDSTATPRVADPGDVAIEAPGLTLERDAQGWSVVAPPITAVVPLALTVTTVDGPLAGQKTIGFGARADNPAPPSFGVPALVAGREAALAVDEPGAELSYRWFSSVGDLTGYTRAEATLEPIAASGYLVVVVRDQAGGTAWTITGAEVAP